MRSRQLALIGVISFCTALAIAVRADTKKEQERIVRLAELEIDPSQIEQYKAALREEIAASIKLEPGVLTLYAVSVKDHPEQIRLFEMYASAQAYESHLQTTHFKQYKAETQSMVRSLKLLQVEPILLGSK